MLELRDDITTSVRFNFRLPSVFREVIERLADEETDGSLTGIMENALSYYLSSKNIKVLSVNGMNKDLTEDIKNFILETDLQLSDVKCLIDIVKFLNEDVKKRNVKTIYKSVQGLLNSIYAGVKTVARKNLVSLLMLNLDEAVSCFESVIVNNKRVEQLLEIKRVELIDLLKSMKDFNL